MSDNIILRKWQVTNYGGVFYLSGVADYHKNLGTNALIEKTSYLVSVEYLDNDIIICNTRNSVYELDWHYVCLDVMSDYIGIRTLGETPLEKFYNIFFDLVNLANNNIYKKFSNNVNITYKEKLSRLLDIAYKGKIEMLDMENKHVDELISTVKDYNNCILLELNSVSGGGIAVYNIDGETGRFTVIPSRVNYEVNYTATTENSHSLHFMYSYNGYSLSFSFIKGNFEKLIIHNLKVSSVTYSNIDISSNDTKVIDLI
ncbi:MAG: hypothetical protein J6A59_13280 [Lachnospiraceae bacterium]|nr:hypothetical protein [Lachnospiraceae bacterium]